MTDTHKCTPEEACRYNSTTMPRIAIKRITRRANQLLALDKRDLAVACAKLEDAATQVAAPAQRTERLSYPSQRDLFYMDRMREALDTLRALTE